MPLPPPPQVSVVQPVGGVGLVGLSLYSHFVVGERLSKWEWCAAGLAGAGTLALGAGSGGDTSDAPSPLRALSVLALIAGSVGVWVSQPPRQATHRRRSGRAGQGARLGFQAGACFGLSAACCRTGFLLAAKWRCAAVLGLAVSLGFSSGGFALQTLGLKDGATVVVCTAAAVGAMLSGVVVGAAALGERLPAGHAARAARLAGWMAVGLGVAGLSAGERGAAQAIDSLGKHPRWRRLMPLQVKQWAARRLAALPETTVVSGNGMPPAMNGHQKI